MIRRYLIAAATAAATLAAAPAQADGLTDMTEAEREAFRTEVRAYLLENPEVIFEAIQILEQRRMEAAAMADVELVRANQEALFNDGYSFVGGNPEGDVTIVEFLDYRCGYCKRAHPHVQELLKRDTNVRYVIKEFPILGPESISAARVAMAALELDPAKYAALHDELMTYKGNMTEQVALRMAGTLGYDIGAIKEAAADPSIEEKIALNYQLAETLGINGTPSFIVGTEIIRGYLPVEDLLGAVQDARSATN